MAREYKDCDTNEREDCVEERELSIYEQRLQTLAKIHEEAFTELEKLDMILIPLFGPESPGTESGETSPSKDPIYSRLADILGETIDQANRLVVKIVKLREKIVM